MVRQRRAAEAADPRRGRRRRCAERSRQAGDVAGAALHGASTSPARRCCCSSRAGASRSTRRRATRCSTRRCGAAALRFGDAEIFSRSEAAQAADARDPRGRRASSTCPTWTSAPRDAAFVPFFGVPAATLLAPSRMARALDMVVQPVVAEILPGGQGYRVRFLPPWTDFPSDDALADTRAHEPLDREPRSAASRRSTCGCTSASRRGRRASRRCTDARAIIRRMRLRFTKMQGAGNDFVVLDATRAPLELDRRAGAPPRRPPLRRRRRPDPGRRADAARRASTSATASSTATATRSSSAATARAASCATCATRA